MAAIPDGGVVVEAADVKVMVAEQVLLNVSVVERQGTQQSIVIIKEAVVMVAITATRETLVNKGEHRNLERDYNHGHRHSERKGITMKTRLVKIVIPKRNIMMDSLTVQALEGSTEVALAAAAITVEKEGHFARECCNVIINTDKGVSRVHAEVVIDSMTSLDPLQRRSTSFSTKVRIKDCSKYGTFLNKKSRSKTKVGEYPNKEAPIKDGDHISFGTGLGHFGSVGVVLELLIVGRKSAHVHVLVDESMPIKEDLLDAIVAQKRVVLKSWLKVYKMLGC
ncbi:hypothetical protein IFM89_026650 [Coptis chinensis]|uniref:FHA domain-containing protein n=1 Tax=Coptis chinensis TaxID=261450 RepID=A0A835LJJ4_9MAGN|nr:hypothetical protein IFM89_026650 [Coptis chinensis]